MCAENIVRRTSRENEELFSGDMSKGRDVCLEVLGKNCGEVRSVDIPDDNKVQSPPSAGTWSSQSVSYDRVSSQKAKYELFLYQEGGIFREVTAVEDL